MSMLSETRQRVIPDSSTIFQELRDEFDEFFGDEEMGKDLEYAVQELYHDPEMDQEKAALLKQKFEVKKQEIVSFFKNEFFLMLAELNLLTESKEIILFFKKVKNAHQSNSKYFKHITMRSAFLIDWLFAVDEYSLAEIKALFLHDLAHESFHIYIRNKFTLTHAKTVEANRLRPTSREAYDKDRGEIACQLYAIKYMRQRAEQVRDEDSDYAKALNERANVISGETKERVSSQ